MEGIFGSEIAEQMGDFWTLDKEGELRGAYKPTNRKYLPQPEEYRLSLDRSGNVVSWRDTGSSKILLAIYCVAD